MNDPIYLYEKVPKDLKENGLSLIDWVDLPEITRAINNQYLFSGTYALLGQHSEEIKKGRFIRAKWEDGSFQYFEITIVTKTIENIAFTAMHIGYGANRNFIAYSFTNLGNGTEIMNNIHKALAFSQPYVYKSTVTHQHQFTAKEVNPIDALIGSNNGNQNLTGVVGGELDMDNFNLVLKDRIGKDNHYTIDFGVNLDSVEEFVDDSSVINSLYLVGAPPEDKQYDKEQPPITIAYLNAPGVTNENRRIAKRENSDCKTKDELKKWGESLFTKERIHEPKVTHKINMIDLATLYEYEDTYKKVNQLHFGDTAKVNLKELGIEVSERFIEGTWYPTIGKWKTIVLGNELGKFSSTVHGQIQEAKQEIIIKHQEATKDLIQASQKITGNDGGHVVHYPKNNPSDILIMDTEDVNTAKQVLRMNKSGIGFSHRGWKGPFDTAWTLDGVFIADFIKAGILSGILVQGVALKTLDDKDFQVVMEGGKVSFERNRVSTGLKDVHGELFGDIQATYDGSGKKANGFAVRQKPGFIFSINTISKNNDGQSVPIIQIPADVHPDNKKVNSYASWVHEGNFSVSNEVDIRGILTGTIGKFDKLYVGGKEVIPGSGTGGGGGGIPPELTTEQEKNAWAVWQFLKSKGYSEQAAAGILGNMQQESGIMPDTDEGEGGPGYGLVQWTSPILGESGRAYVQRLLGQSGIGGDYRNINTQLQLLEWHMHNGQYVPSGSYPYSVTEFKALTDIGTATMAFEANFERPAATHPERIDSAIFWYNKLHNLKPSQNTWMNPVRSSYTITQEWDNPDYWSNGQAGIHGGIDVASMPAGSMPPVYAARAGTVITSTYDGTGGNYVVVQHDDGYFTYYGHLNSVSVSVGAKVDTNTQIGIMGSTGGATGVHLHFEVWHGGQWKRINPRDVINF